MVAPADDCAFRPLWRNYGDLQGGTGICWKSLCLIFCWPLGGTNFWHNLCVCCLSLIGFDPNVTEVPTCYRRAVKEDAHSFFTQKLKTFLHCVCACAQSWTDWNAFFFSCCFPPTAAVPLFALHSLSFTPGPWASPIDCYNFKVLKFWRCALTMLIINKWFLLFSPPVSPSKRTWAISDTANYSQSFLLSFK